MTKLAARPDMYLLGCGREAIEAASAELRYLPPYSQDLNPIELAFYKFKKLLGDGAERIAKIVSEN